MSCFWSIKLKPVYVSNFGISGCCDSEPTHSSCVTGYIPCTTGCTVTSHSWNVGLHVTESSWISLRSLYWYSLYFLQLTKNSWEGDMKTKKVYCLWCGGAVFMGWVGQTFFHKNAILRQKKISGVKVWEGISKYAKGKRPAKLVTRPWGMRAGRAGSRLPRNLYHREQMGHWKILEQSYIPFLQ